MSSIRDIWLGAIERCDLSAGQEGRWMGARARRETFAPCGSAETMSCFFARLLEPVLPVIRFVFRANVRVKNDCWRSAIVQKVFNSAEDELLNPRAIARVSNRMATSGDTPGLTAALSTTIKLPYWLGTNIVISW